MPDAPLTPAARQEVREALAFALRYDNRGKASRAYQNPAADAAAEHLVEALERSGFVVMRKAPAPAHTGHVPAHGVKLDGP